MAFSYQITLHLCDCLFIAEMPQNVFQQAYASIHNSGILPTFPYAWAPIQIRQSNKSHFLIFLLDFVEGSCDISIVIIWLSVFLRKYDRKTSWLAYSEY